MVKLENMLRESRLDYFGESRHKINIDQAMKQYQMGEAVILDVRTSEELDYIRFGFARHIPLHELPDRMDEIDRDKMIIVFCTSANRSAIIYTYLKTKDYNARILSNPIEEIAGYFKPTYVLNNHKNDYTDQYEK
ncbi:MAG: hypothetical protein JW702_05050 [Clostridiales bacterium]|nr:hypothetical protein [Clostridiales bacterium]